MAAVVKGLDALPQTRLIAASSLYRSAPLDAQGPDFVNAVAELRTALAPEQLLVELQRLEQQHGRKRPYENAPRTLDLDLLIFGRRCIETPTLTLPHPRLGRRAFVLAPLAELAPSWPLGDGRTVAEALAAVADQDAEKIIE